MIISGIYQILNLNTNKFYIGSGVDLNLRWSQHKWEFKNNKHGNSILQRSWNKHGEAAFEFIVIELAIPEKLLEREQFWIDNLNACDKNIGYNIRPKAHSNLGIKWSNEHKAKISKTKTGVKQNSEAVRARAIAITGIPRSEETKAKISAGHKGKILTAEHKAKLSIAKRKKFDIIFNGFTGPINK